MNDAAVGDAAVVTGALGGIGTATCNLLASKGYRVIGVDRHEVRLASLVKLFVGDVCDETLRRGRYCVDETHGHLDAQINIAGRNYFALIADADLAEWRSMMDVNVLGMVAPIKHLSAFFEAPTPRPLST